MKRIINLLLICLILFASVISMPSDANSAGTWPTDVVLYGGTVGGSWNLCMTVISDFLPKAIPGIRTTSSPGTGLGNVAGVQSGQVTFALSNLTTSYDGIKGLAPFEGPQDKIRNVAYIYIEPTHIMVRADSDINSIADMKGKMLGTFAPGNTAELVCRQLLSLYDMTYDDVNTSFASASDLAEQFKDGMLDMVSYASAMPHAVIVDITTSRKIRLLSLNDDELDRMKKINEAYFATTIPKGTYDGVDYDARTLGVIQHIICSIDLDEEFVYQSIKAMVENISTIKGAHIAFSGLTPEIMATDLGMPFHPGAERYFREVGLIK